MIIRYLRLYCATPASEPERHRDGVVAVAAIEEKAALARLLLADMGAWGRNPGASVTSAIGPMMIAAYRQLIWGFGISLAETLVVERDVDGHFDLMCDPRDGDGYRRMPLFARGGRSTARTAEAFVSWAGAAGQAMLERAEAVGIGEWAGVEG
jgi:hypothetical protein